jgi:hypothetical protein
MQLFLLHQSGTLRLRCAREEGSMAYRRPSFGPSDKSRRSEYSISMTGIMSPTSLHLYSPGHGNKSTETTPSHRYREIVTSSCLSMRFEYTFHAFTCQFRVLTLLICRPLHSRSLGWEAWSRPRQRSQIQTINGQQRLTCISTSHAAIVVDSSRRIKHQLITTI